VDDISRRDRKLARTRLDLLDALRTRLAKRPLEEISIRELADAADISEATFFNHFPTKADLAFYFVQLWSLDAGWHARRAEPRGARAAIEAILDATAADVAAHPRVMAEVIAFQARMPGKVALRPVSRAERRLAFPDRDGIDELEDRGLDGLLPALIDRAIERGELPRTVDRQAAFLAITNVFFGVPLILGPRAPEQVAAAYRQQLDLVWKGLSA
jgi:AcrR family transcriptional regulator